MAKLAKFILKLLKVLLIVVGVLFVVYFWNLDQKVLGWAYKQVNAASLSTRYSNLWSCSIP